VSSTPEGRGLRILVVNWLDRENPQAGGAEEHLHEIFGRLVRRGHDVTVLVSGWRGCEQRATLDGLEVHRAGRRYTFSLAGPRYFRRHLARRDFDIVVEDLNKVPMYCRFWTRGPVVLLAHHLFGRTAFQAAPLPVALTTWLLERTIPRFYRSMSAVVVSESTRQDLVDQGLGPAVLEVIPNGIEVDRFTPGPPEARSERPSLLFLGRLKQYKRLDLVLEAMPRIVEAGFDVELVVGGDGDQLHALKEQVRRLDLESRVTFLGFITEGEKLAALRRAWLHVLTSSKEGWGISNLEAGACATPTVASDSPGLRESVVHGRTGLLVPHGDASALAEAIIALLGDDERRVRMGRNARVFASRYSWDASAEAFEAHLRRVVAESGLD
jgi:glycosyltransferase involved in cell wall biosynthesis